MPAYFGTLFGIPHKNNALIMKSILKFIFTLITFTLLVPCFAQAVDPNYDPKAKVILDEVTKSAKSYTTIAANFSITINKAGNASDVKNGSLMLKAGKYKISIENKVKTAITKEEYYNDGATTWVYSEKDKEVNIDCYDPKKNKNENSISPNDLFTIHEKGFKYKFIKEETQSGKVVQLIDLYPEKADKKNYSIVKVTIDKLKKQIIKVVFTNKDGSSTVYTVKTFTPNGIIADTAFQFNTKANPGVAVVDLRDGDCQASEK